MALHFHWRVHATLPGDVRRAPGLGSVSMAANWGLVV